MHDRRVPPQQHLARMADSAQQRERLGGEDFQMLGRIVVDEVDRRLQRRCDHDAATGAAQHRLRKRHALRAHACPQSRQRRRRRVRDRPARRHQIGRGVRPMLGLDQQVQGGGGAVGVFVGQDDRLTGAGRRAGVDHVGQQPFRRLPSTDCPVPRSWHSAAPWRCRMPPPPPPARRHICIPACTPDQPCRQKGRRIDLTLRPRRRDDTDVRARRPPSAGMLVIIATLGNDPLPRGT